MAAATEAPLARKPMRARLVLVAALALLLPGARCTPLPAFPPLLSSVPMDGETQVLRTAWLRFTFDGSTSGATSLTLECNGAPVAVVETKLFSNEVILNPAADLPDGASCEVSWLSPSGPQSVSFNTAVAGPGAVLFYDRTDPRGFAPLPDDLLLVPEASNPTGFQVAIPAPTIPGAPFEQALVNGLVGAANQADGWSPVGYFAAELSAPLDPSTLPASPQDSLDPLSTVTWFDLTPGSATIGDRIPTRVEHRANLDPNTGKTHYTLLAFPSIRLTPGGRYAIVVSRRVAAATGEPLEPSPSFANVLGSFQPGEPMVVTDARTLTDSLLAEIAATAEIPFDAQDVAVALQLTIRSGPALVSDMLTLRAAVDALPAPTLTVATTSGSPFSDIAVEIRGTFNAPEFRDLSGLLARDANGDPIQTGTNDVPFVLALPQSALTTPAPLIMYQHGTPGSAEEVPQNLGNRFSTTGATLGSEGFAMIGFTDTVNRELGLDLAAQAQAYLLTIISRSDVPDYDIQSWAEQVAMVKMLETLGTLDVLPLVGGLPGGDGVPDLDVSTLLYLGISQGAVKGSATMAYLPEIRAAVLAVGGARNGELLVHQAEFTGVLAQLQVTLPGLTPSEIWTGFIGYQMGYDAQEPHHHAPHLYLSPHNLGVPQRASILLTEGIGDSLVPNHGTRALVHTLGPVLQVEPVQQTSPVVTSTPGPLTANVNATTTAGYYQYVPVGVPGISATPGCAFIAEGHVCGQSAPEVLRQRIEFFNSALTDPAPTIIDPLLP